MFARYLSWYRQHIAVSPDFHNLLHEMEGCNRTDAIVSRSRGTRDGVIVGREQHCVRFVLVRSRNFDEDVGSFKVCSCPWTTVQHSRIEVVDNFNVRIDRFDPGQ